MSEHQNAPIQLSGPWPRMTQDARARAERKLAGGCWCGSSTATFKKRNQGTYITVWLQCDNCGKGFGEPFKRNDHYNWQDYPLWDETIGERFNARRRAIYDERRRAQMDHWAKQRADYAEWCRTSPEWQDIVSKVLRRANGTCEACLSRPAVTAHHLSYEQGKLPPAWQLKAICKQCHDRIHADKLGYSDEWCPLVITWP